MAAAPIPPPPVRPLRERLIDGAVWGGVAVLLLASAVPQSAICRVSPMADR